jgi:hypothetical protein
MKRHAAGTWRAPARSSGICFTIKLWTASSVRRLAAEIPDQSIHVTRDTFVAAPKTTTPVKRLLRRNHHAAGIGPLRGPPGTVSACGGTDSL